MCVRISILKSYFQKNTKEQKKTNLICQRIYEKVAILVSCEVHLYLIVNSMQALVFLSVSLAGAFYTSLGAVLQVYILFLKPHGRSSFNASDTRQTTSML